MTIGDIIDREVEEAIENNTRQVKVNAILELLEDADGEISDALKGELSSVTDSEQLKRLLKMAAKADSVAEFEQRMKEIRMQ